MTLVKEAFIVSLPRTLINDWISKEPNMSFSSNNLGGINLFLLTDAINNQLQFKKDLNKFLAIKLCSLTNSITWLKVQLIKYLINQHIENLMNKIKKPGQKS